MDFHSDTVSYDELSTVSQKVILDDLYGQDYTQKAETTVTFETDVAAGLPDLEVMDFIEDFERSAGKYERWLALQRLRGAVIQNNQLIYWPPICRVTAWPVLLRRPLRFFAGLMSPDRGRHWHRKKQIERN